MRTKFTIPALLALTFTAGCVTSDLERAGIGAVAGGVTAAAVGGSVATGVLAGAAIGAVCDEVTNICR